MLPEDIDPDEFLSRLNGHPDEPLLATTEYTTLSAAPRRAWNGIHRGSPKIALETDSEDTPVDRQSAREQVLEKLVPLLEAGLSPSQVLDYWATEDTKETHGAFTQPEWAEIRGVSRQAVGANAGNARDVLDDY